jgi:glyoxylase-like metal-dependent hydrolase (beta-lactamase superfamily II)
MRSDTASVRVSLEPGEAAAAEPPTAIIRVPLGVVIGKRVLLPFVNAYLVRLGKQWIVVDTGPPGCAGVLHAALHRHGIRDEQVSLILLTHGHFDHGGSARELRRELGGRTPIALHPADRRLLTEGRFTVPLRPTSWSAAISLLFGTALVVLYTVLGRNTLWSEDELAQVLWLEGIEGEDAVELPPCPEVLTVRAGAHTVGSLAFRLPSGAVLSGDLLSRTPLGALDGPALVEAPEEIGGSLRRVAALSPTEVFPGHGAALPGDAAETRADQEMSRRK